MKRSVVLTGACLLAAAVAGAQGFGKNKVLAYEFNPLLFEFKEKSSQERFRAW